MVVAGGGGALTSVCCVHNTRSVAGQAEDEEEDDDEDEDEDEGDDAGSGSEEDTDEDEEEVDGAEEAAAEEGGAPSGEIVLREGVIVAQLMQVLRGFVDEGFPHGALAHAIDRHWVKVLEECEDEPSDALQNYLLPELIFADHIEAYCRKDGTRATALNTEPVLDELRSKDDSFWRQLLSKWVVDAPVAEVVMKPSKALVKSRAAAEKLGIEQRRATLGEQGLSTCKTKLEEAMTANAPKPLPTGADGRIALAPVPPASSIPLLPTTAKTLKIPRTLGLRGALEEAPGATAQVVRTSTMFHTVCVGFDCRRVPAHLRPWLVLLQVHVLSQRSLSGEQIVSLKVSKIGDIRSS